MKKIVNVLLLSAVGCVGTLCLVLAVPAQAAPVKAAAAQTVYKVYRENGQYVGTVIVTKPADLTAYASQLGAGTYRLVSVDGHSATTERRIIVYQTTSLTADRRIIVY